MSGICRSRDDGKHGVTRLAKKNPTLFNEIKNSSASVWRTRAGYPSIGRHRGDWNSAGIDAWDAICAPTKVAAECGSRKSNDRKTHRCSWQDIITIAPIPSQPARPASGAPMLLGGYKKFDNHNSGAVNLTDKNGAIKFKGSELDGATMCNHYNSCTGFTHDYTTGGGNLKRGSDSNKFLQGAVNYYSKVTSVTAPEGGNWGGLSALVKKEAELQNTVSNGCWNCRSIVGTAGCNEAGTATQNGSVNNDWDADWFKKCNATCKSWNKREWGTCKGTSSGGSKSDSVCATRSWKECGDGGGAKCWDTSRISDINNPECVWVDRGPPPLSTQTINRRSGVRKTYYDEIQTAYNSLRAPYDNRRDVEIPQAEAARTTALSNQATTLKKQREDLEQMLSDKYSKLTKEHQEILRNLVQKSAALEKKRQLLDDEHRQLQIVFEEKKARIIELQNTIKVETENAMALTAALKEELTNLENDKLLAEQKIMDAKKSLQIEKIKIDSIINDINKKTIEYSDLLVKSRARGERIIGLEDIKDSADKANKIISKEISIAPGIYNIHKESLKELEAELAEYLKNPDQNPIILVKLLNRKKKLMGQLFDSAEKKYTVNTDRIDRRHLVEAPTNILLNNQENELKQNKRKIDNLSKDLSTSAKRTQVNNNEFRKRDYFLFLLKYVGVFILLSLLTGLLIKNGSVSLKIGYTVITILTLVLVTILVLNMYFNRNRNRLYFNKRDWSGVISNGGTSKKCPK